MRALAFFVAVLVCAFGAVSTAAAQETVRFTDPFAGSLDGWAPWSPVWTVESGELHGTFTPYCGNNPDWCPEGDLLLRDFNQPRTADWRTDVDFKGANAMFVLWTSYREKKVFSIGSNAWSGGVLNSAQYSVRTFGPWSTTATGSAAITWDPASFNKATLEKRANVFTLSLNDQVVASLAVSVSGSPRIGIHVTGSCVLDNFRLTEIGAPVTYTISGTVRTSGGQPLGGVTVTTAPGGATATTDANGNYSIPGLDDRTTYTVTPGYNDSLGTWTFSQPVYLKTISGANITGADFTAFAPGTETETLWFADDFSGTLSAWVSTGGGWSIANGQLNGTYSIYCGNMLCSHTYLLLADQYQPRTADWRMEVDFNYTTYALYDEAAAEFARWSTAGAAEMYYIGWGADSWAGAPQSSVRWQQQTWAPTWLSAYFAESSTFTWSPLSTNRAKLEKRGDVYLFYLNDHLIGVGTGSVLTGSPKLGLHIYGNARLDNFKLTELGTTPAPPNPVDVSIQQTASASAVVTRAPLTYVLTVFNAGPGPASNVTVTDDLPAGSSFVSANGSGWSCGNAAGVVTCTRASLAVGSSSQITIVIDAPPAGQGAALTNTAAVATAIDDPAPSNNSSTAVVQLVTVEGDFDENSRSDILWRNSATGSNALWLMNGESIVSSLFLPAVDAEWTAGGAGDFSGDGRQGVVWMNNTTGDVVVWLMNGSSVSATPVTTVNHTDWKIFGVGDFDGDGKTDVLWRHVTTGDTVVWLMNGAQIKSAKHLAMVRDLNWTIAGIGDFDGDGRSDVLWRNNNSGANLVWLMNGASIGTKEFIPIMPQELNEQIIGVGDTDGDRNADILWLNRPSGEVLLWSMNGTSVSRVSTVAILNDTAWHTEGLGDFDGDGKADVIWRNADTGGIAVWLMNGSTLAKAAYITAVGPAWTIVAPK